MLELLIVMFAFLASIFLQAFMVNVPVEQAKVDCDINIEDVIARHGVIVPNHYDFERELMESYWFDEEQDIPDGTTWAVLPKHEPIRSLHHDRANDGKRCCGKQPKYKNRSWSRKHGS